MDVEWLTRLVAFYLLRSWSRTLLCALNAAATLFRSFTLSPPRCTMLEVIWWALAPTFLRLRPLHDVWPPAHHVTHAAHHLAHLHATAHSPATTGAHHPQAWAAPLSALLDARVLLYHCGALTPTLASTRTSTTPVPAAPSSAPPPPTSSTCWRTSPSPSTAYTYHV